MINSFVRAVIAATVLVFSAGVQSQQGGGQNAQQESAAKDPRARAKIHTELGSLYFQDGNIPVAMEELTIAIYLDPTYAPAYGMRALVHNFLKEPQYAEDNFREAARYAPDDPEIANNYGWFLCQGDKKKEAMAQFERALRNRLYQTPERAYLNAGQCAVSMGRLFLGRRLSAESLSIDGRSPARRLALGRFVLPHQPSGRSTQGTCGYRAQDGAECRDALAGRARRTQAG
jgi:type IV pilus assembly protein PilF